MTTDTDFRLTNTGHRDVEFTGVLLAEVSTADPGKELWSEFRVYRTSGGKYVGEKVGRTVKPGQQDKFFVVVAATADELVEKLYETRGNPNKRFIPNYVFDCLMDAADDDEALAAALVQKVD